MKKLVVLAVLAASLSSAWAFSLLGPPKEWQITAIGYQLPGDIGAPMDLTAFYRWNVTNITYAFDSSFINYFGTNGIQAVDDAFAVLNALPPASQINLDDYPLDTKVRNATAAAAGLIDLKSRVLSMLVEQLGLAEPERWVWALRARNTVTQGGVTTTNYTVIKQNYDPYTLRPSSYVNGVLYTYSVEEPIPTQNYADAVESVVGVNEFIPFSSVAGAYALEGEVVFGLTRDDVGGLRYLLSTNTLAIEGVITGVSGSSLYGTTWGWIPWYGSTNFSTNFFVSTNALAGLTNGSNFVATGIRGGGNKISFHKVYYDSLLGTAFVPITNQYTDNVIVTNRMITQKMQRAITQPDIVFVAEDLGVVNNLTPVLSQRTGTGTWVNNDSLNGLAVEGGPGIIQGPVRLSFSTRLPYFINSTPDALDEASASGGFVWGSFDHTARAPIIYPEYQNITVEQLLSILGRYTNSIP